MSCDLWCLMSCILSLPHPCWAGRVLTGSLSINALHACVYIYIHQLSYFRVSTVWFIDLTVATCYSIHFSEFMSNLFHEKMDKKKKLNVRHFMWYKNGRWRLFIGAQNVNTERASLHVSVGHLSCFGPTHSVLDLYSVSICTPHQHGHGINMYSWPGQQDGGALHFWSWLIGFYRCGSINEELLERIVHVYSDFPSNNVLKLITLGHNAQMDLK